MLKNPPTEATEALPSRGAAGSTSATAQVARPQHQASNRCPPARSSPGARPRGSPCAVTAPYKIRWMDEIRHHPRNPGMMTPLHFPENNGVPWFRRRCRISSIHSMSLCQRGLGTPELTNGVFWIPLKGETQENKPVEADLKRVPSNTNTRT